MSQIEKINNTIDTESMDITSFLTAFELTANQITDAIFVIKANSADEAPIIEKTISGQQLSLNVDTNILSIFFQLEDYGQGKLEPNQTYFLAVAFEFNKGSGAVRREVKLKTNSLRIEPDSILNW